MTSNRIRYLLALTSATLVAASTLSSQTVEAFQVPFQVFSGEGTADFVPLVEGQSADHFITTGAATLLGNYTGQGEVRLDTFTSATTADFSSAQPFVFTGQNGDELAFNYAGNVSLGDAGGGLAFGTFVAEFNPVLGSGTGQFADVIGGSFIMTAITEAFALVPGPAPGNEDVAYTWSSDEGYLMFVPEPSSLALLMIGGIVSLRYHRRRRERAD